MADKIQDDFQYEGADLANKKYGNTPDGRKLLSSDLGEKVLNDNEEISRLKSENVRDALTGAYNRRYIDHEIAKIKPTDKFAVVMIDIDGFKRFNDTYGHPIGDMALKSVTNVIQNNVQIVEGDQPDIVGRYGGEEFIIIFRKFNDPRAIERRVETIRNEIKSRVIDRDNAPVVVTSSFGMAFSDGVTTAEALVSKADKALYESKNNGRDRVTVAK